MPGNSDILQELGWTALSIISMSLVFIYSISVVGNARPTVSSPAYPSYLAISQQQKARILAEKQREQRRKVIREDWLKRGFRLKRLPPELQLLILSYSADWPETFRALVLVSRYIYNSTLRACLPIMPITLSSTKQLASFESLVYRKKNTCHGFGNLVHRLWISPLRKEDLVHTYHILRACVNIRVLACDARVLALSMHSPNFKHSMCRDFTLLLSRPKWVNALKTSSGIQFFRQLTHLRVMEEQCVPKTLSFDCLLYLSYREPFSNPGEIASEIQKPSALSNQSMFPSLKQVVLTRQCGIEERAPLLCDPTLVLLHVRRDCTEMETWRNNFKGKGLWQQAAKALPSSKKLTL